MKLTVDPWKCQSHMQCIATAPEILSYDEDHSYAVASVTDVPPEQEHAAREAVARCPERAITLEP